VDKLIKSQLLYQLS